MSEAPAAPEPPSDGARPADRGMAVLGAILVVAGVAFFGIQYLDIAWEELGWPLYVALPGLALLALGMSRSGAAGLSIAGSIVTVVGLVLFYQNATDRWESWAYAWALVAPAGSGVGMALHGLRFGERKLARDGFRAIVVGLALFGVGLVFFEGIIGLSGAPWDLAEWVLPVALIGLGVLVLAQALVGARRGAAG